VVQLFSSGGKCLEVQDENAVDAATAVSGSGPAYLFYLAEQMIEVAKTLGFSGDEAELLVKQTLQGASLLLQNEESAAELRRRVTSPGGTTEAALKRFGEGKVEEHLRAGLECAYKRARQLSGSI
jgi:pyrroline-5-carboxylate reductase